MNPPAFSWWSFSELLIDRVVVTDGEVEIRSVIPTQPNSEHVRFCQLRKDYFDNIIEVFHLADDDRRAVLFVVTADRCRIGLTAIDRDLLRHTVPPDRLFEKAQRRCLVPMLRQEKVNGLPRLVYGAIEIVPLASG